jgi:hypothetical protein
MKKSQKRSESEESVVYVRGGYGAKKHSEPYNKAKAEAL